MSLPGVKHEAKSGCKPGRPYGVMEDSPWHDLITWWGCRSALTLTKRTCLQWFFSNFGAYPCFRSLGLFEGQLPAPWTEFMRVSTEISHCRFANLLHEINHLFDKWGVNTVFHYLCVFAEICHAISCRIRLMFWLHWKPPPFQNTRVAFYLQ